MDGMAVSELTLKASAKRVEIVEDARISSCGRGGKMPVAKIRSSWSKKSPESSESSASWWNSGTGPLEQLSCLRIRALLDLTGLISAASTALRWTSRHLDF